MIGAVLAFVAMLSLPGAALYYLGPLGGIAAALTVYFLWSPIMVNFDYDYSRGTSLLPTGMQLIANSVATVTYIIASIVIYFLN